MGSTLPDLRCTVAGMALTAPLPVTFTGCPSLSWTSIANGSVCTTAGEGLGNMPGHGPSDGVRRLRGIREVGGDGGYPGEGIAR